MKPQGTQLSLFETRSTGDAFAVRVSARARRLTARVHVGGRVEIVVPVGVNARAVRDFVQRFTPWIDRKVAAMQCFAEPAAAVPERIDFAFTGERFDVDWQQAPRRELVARGAAGCRCARRIRTQARQRLQDWLKQAAQERLAPPLLQACARFELFRRAGGHPLPAHPLGQLLDARHGEPQLLAGVSAAGGGALSVRARAGAHSKHMNHSAGFLAPGARRSSPTTAGWTASCSPAGARCRSGSSGTSR